MIEDYMDLRSEVIEEINILVDDFRNRAWEGSLGNPETEWNQYIEKLYDAGLKDLVNKFYNDSEFEPYVRPDIN